MQMTVEEIIRSYTQAKDKSKQIGILADLNGCDKEKIRAILISKGCQMPTKGRPRKTSTSTKRTTSTKKKEPTSTEKMLEDLVRKDEFESPLRPLNATFNKDGLCNVEFKNIDTREKFTVDMIEAVEDFQHRPTLPDIVKNMIKERLVAIESKIMELRLDKEELEDFLEQFADDV